jgi:hypothetical protein
MEWLAANAFNIFTAVIAICGGIVFAMGLDHRLKNIEREQAETKQLVVTSARLEERISSLYQIVIGQGKRLDRVVERFNGSWKHKDEEECDH